MSTRYLGIDLAWSEGSSKKAANESGVVALEADGRIVDAGWTNGLDQTVAWIEAHATDDTVLFIDAPLVILNGAGKRPCEAQVSTYYGRWGVSANSSNLGDTFGTGAAGVRLCALLRGLGWTYDDGVGSTRPHGKRFSECNPYATLAGAREFGYVLDTSTVGSKPTYKRQPEINAADWMALGLPGPVPPKKKLLPSAQWQPSRAAVCDELIRRFAAFTACDPPIDLRSHPAAAALVDEPSPLGSTAYKHREDLLDAAICAWTATLWHRAPQRCLVLGQDDPLIDADGKRATIIAPRPLAPDEAGPPPATQPQAPATWRDVLPTLLACPPAATSVPLSLDAHLGTPQAPPSTDAPARSASDASSRATIAAVTSGPKMDLDDARDFIAAIPAGQWVSYGDVAAAAGNPKGAQAIGTWLLKSVDVVPNMHRVLRVDGGVSGGWTPNAVGHPQTEAEAIATLGAEGITFDANGRASSSQRWPGPNA